MNDDRIKDLIQRALSEGVKKQDSKKRREDIRRKGHKGSGDVNIKHFDNLTDWLMSSMLVSIMHAVPEVDEEGAMDLAQILFRNIAMPGSVHLWMKPKNRIKRIGLKQAKIKLGLELMRGMYD